MKIIRLYFSPLIWILFYCTASVFPAVAQAGISVTADVDRTTLPSDEELTLTLTVAGDFQQMGDPRFPLLSAFDIVGSSRSSQFSMVNGVVTARTVFSYRLHPTVEGSVIIDPITVLVNGAPYQTQPISVQVTSAAATTPRAEPGNGQKPRPTAPSTPGGLEGQDFYVKADVDKPTPVVGQQIIYRFRFYQAVNLYSQPRLDWPTFSGFWTEDLKPDNVFEHSVGGRSYRVTEIRLALFPTGAGPVTIPQAILTIPGDLFNTDIVLESEPVVIDVQPLPAPSPDGFLGAVGQFELVSWVKPTETSANEPVTLFVRVSGIGNVTALSDPTEGKDALLPDWRVFDPQTTTTVSQVGDAVHGEKLFERLLVPKTAGDLTIPPLSLVYFDSQAAEYRRVESDPVVVQVRPGEDLATGLLTNGNNKQDITLLGSDIRHIKASPPSLVTHRTQLLESPLYWLGWVVPPLVMAGVYTWDRRRRRLSGDRAYARAQRAHRVARKRLAEANRRAREDGDGAYAIVARALNDYLADKFNLPSASLTRDVIRRTSAAHNLPEQLVEGLLTCLEWADSGRFAPVAAGREIHELIAEAEAIIAHLERNLRAM